MTSDNYTPRFSFEITEEQKARADNLISTYGLRKALFRVILDDLLDMIEKHGQFVVGAILEKQVKSNEVIPILKEVEEKFKNGS